MLELDHTTALLAHERWLPVPGFEHWYDVSTAGRVRSRARATPRILRPSKHPGGYLKATLYRDGAHKQMLIHRIVLLTFRGPCPAGMEGAHLNGVPTDNRLENLTWATSAENHSHKVAHGTSNRGERNHQAKLDEYSVRAIRALYRRRDPGANYSALAKRFGVSFQQVHDVVKRRVWKHVH